MKYPDLIRNAWRLTVDHKYLSSIGTLTSFFAIVVGIWRVRYFLPTPIGTRDIYAFFQTNTSNPILYLIILYIVYYLIYFISMFTNVLAEGGLIGGIAKIEDQHVRLTFGKCLSLGLHAFLPLFEYRAVTSLLNIGNFILYVLLFRYISIYYQAYYGGGDTDILASFYPFIIFAGIIVAIISLFLTYGEYNLVIHRAGVFKSIRRSITLVIFHLSETLLMTVLVALISIRALINIILVFLIPGAIILLIEYLSLKVSLTITLSLAIVVGLVLFWFSAKIAGTLMAFTTAVWTLTFMDLDKRQEHKILASESDDEDSEEHGMS